MTEKISQATTQETLRHLFDKKLLTDVDRDVQLEAYLREQGGFWLELLEKALATRNRNGLTIGLGHYIGLLMYEKLRRAVINTLQRDEHEKRIAKEIFKYLLAYRRFVYLAIYSETTHRVWYDTQAYVMKAGFANDFPEIPPQISHRIRGLADRTIKTYKNSKSGDAIKALQQALEPKPVSPLQELKQLGL